MTWATAGTMSMKEIPSHMKRPTLAIVPRTVSSTPFKDPFPRSVDPFSFEVPPRAQESEKSCWEQTDYAEYHASGCVGYCTLRAKYHGHNTEHEEAEHYQREWKHSTLDVLRNPGRFDLPC